MELAMTNGFTELNQIEMLETEGGIALFAVALGALAFTVLVASASENEGLEKINQQNDENKTALDCYNKEVLGIN